MNSDQRPHLAARATDILQANDTGTSIKAAPNLYPHQWSWDAAIVAIGLSHVSVDRAVTEMRSLFRGQWRNGLLPHIVYAPDVPDDAYFPDAARWDVAGVSPDAPLGVATSGIIQPPVHAIAIAAICERADPEQAGAIATEFYHPLLEWHRYLLSARDPEVSGLITIVHPWESGMDNSPRWDRALACIDVPSDELPPFQRRDLAHVEDASQRPTDEDYDRYLWLVELLKRGGYRVDQLYPHLPFRMKDVFMSALLVTANEALLRIATLADAGFDDLTIIESWIDRGREGIAGQWDNRRQLCLDQDVVEDTPVAVRTIAAFAPLVAGQVTVDVRRALIELWYSEAFTGHPNLRWPLPTSTSPDEPSFSPRTYWQGPVWPVMNWLLWWSWERIGETQTAAELREHALAQIESAGFAEYMEPFTGEPLGSGDQSWTAAVVLDWLADDAEV
jgi:glucosylglycerate hydrolase